MKYQMSIYLTLLSGEYGMGTMANELSLGCDCLGQIHYLVSVPSNYRPKKFESDMLNCIFSLVRL